jgi:hypothetical protein
VTGFDLGTFDAHLHTVRALARALRDRAIGEGADLVVDTVLGDAEAAVRLGRLLDLAGYTVEVLDVEVPFEVSRQRVTDRWRQALADGAVLRLTVSGAAVVGTGSGSSVWFGVRGQVILGQVRLRGRQAPGRHFRLG